MCHLLQPSNRSWQPKTVPNKNRIIPSISAINKVYLLPYLNNWTNPLTVIFMPPNAVFWETFWI
jgi:hypothetical protein